jgi:hypothetical protein
MLAESIPDHEIDLLTNTVDTAISYVEVDQYVEAHAELVYGLRRSEVLKDEGHEWAETLCTRWQIAVHRFCEEFLPQWE